MRTKQLPHRIIQYIIGLVCMAIGLVLLKITHWGVSPITALPDAVANITPLTLGNATILLHLLCVVLQIIVQKRVTLKSVLCMCVGVPFGYLVDFFLWVWVTLFPELVLWQKVLSLVVGIAIQGFGVALISGCDLMLPAPDELNNVIANTYHKQLSNVKMIADAVYVAGADDQPDFHCAGPDDLQPDQRLDQLHCIGAPDGPVCGPVQKALPQNRHGAVFRNAR